MKLQLNNGFPNDIYLLQGACSKSGDVWAACTERRRFFDVNIGRPTY